MILGVLFAFDIVDIYSFSYVAPTITQEWGLSLHSIGIATSSTFLGMFFGAVTGGRISDKFGRRRTIVGGVLLFSTASLLTTLANSVGYLIAARFINGFGIQATTGVLIVYAAEMFPRASRGRSVSLMLAIGLLGAPVAAAFARVVIPLGEDTWRWVFVLGAAGVIPCLLALRILPESVRWECAQGRIEQAMATVERLEAEAERQYGTLPEPVEEPPVLPVSPRELVRGANIRNLLVGVACLVLTSFAFFGFNAYVPTLLVEHGYSHTAALTLTLVFAFAAVPGALLAWPLIDRLERKWAIFALAVVIAALLLGFGNTGNATVVTACGFLLSMLLQTLTAFLYAYLPELFPTPLRGLGQGVSNGLGRLAVFSGGFLFAPMLEGLGFSGFFAVMAGVLVMGGGTVGVFGIRTAGRALRENTARPTGAFAHHAVPSAKESL
ncbi:MFS transporter [Streptomyces canus]|uniref:MFS transporter n=1 Tax=Streptomyces canus TaxID=58343 RepID=UPI000376DCD7|nr:MFS transporter [Streptomyces canus]